MTMKPVTPAFPVVENPGYDYSRWNCLLDACEQASKSMLSPLDEADARDVTVPESPQEDVTMADVSEQTAQDQARKSKRMTMKPVTPAFPVMENPEYDHSRWNCLLDACDVELARESMRPPCPTAEARDAIAEVRREELIERLMRDIEARAGGEAAWHAQRNPSNRLSATASTDADATKVPKKASRKASKKAPRKAPRKAPKKATKAKRAGGAPRVCAAAAATAAVPEVAQCTRTPRCTKHTGHQGFCVGHTHNNKTSRASRETSRMARR